MTKTVNQLTATKIQHLKAPGMYPDGGGLYLQVTGDAAQSWILRYSLRGKPREMGLGSLRKVSLADARRKTAEYHQLLDDHVDPIEHRKRARDAAVLAAASSVTFKEAAAKCIAMRVKGLKNAKHAAEWTTSITTNAAAREDASHRQAAPIGPSLGCSSASAAGLGIGAVAQFHAQYNLLKHCA
jgi:hypothetical protein